MPRRRNDDPRVVQINVESDMDISPETGGHAVAEYAHLEEEGKYRASSGFVVTVGLAVLALSIPVLWTLGLLAWSTPVLGLELGVVWAVLLALLLGFTIYLAGQFFARSL